MKAGRKVTVAIDGREIQPPAGTVVVPVLVSEDLYDSAFAEQVRLSGCGAAAKFDELDNGFATVTLTHGPMEAH